MLAVKNGEIKLNTANRQIQILHEQNVKFQHQVNEAVAKAENLDRELHTQKEILKQMEMTKKEYIEKLKKELDTIEVRYQHLLNENCMIGEDFRSQARENRLYSDSLLQQIRELEEERARMQAQVDDRDLQIVQWERKGENFQMNLEEYLTCYDLMRGSRDGLLEQVAELEQAGRNKDNTIGALEEELRQMELLATEGKATVGT